MDDGELVFNSATFMQDVIDSDVNIDPSNKDHLKALDSHFNTVFKPTLEGKSDSEVFQATVAYAASAGAIPPSLENSLRQDLNSGSTSVQGLAADYIKNLSDQDPRFVQGLSNDELAYAVKVSEAMSAGLTSQEATDRAKRQVYEKGTEVYKSRLSDFKSLLRDQSMDLGDLDIDVANEDNVPPALTSSWNTAFEYFYVDQQMPEDMARDLANKRVSASWGETRFGNGVMVNPPEKIYGIKGMDNDWIFEQAAEAVSQSYLWKDSSEFERVKDDIFLVSLDTHRSKRPKYQIGFYDENGLVRYAVKPGTNEPLEWRPDSNKVLEEYIKKSNKEREEALRDLETGRSEFLENPFGAGKPARGL